MKICQWISPELDQNQDGVKDPFVLEGKCVYLSRMLLRYSEFHQMPLEELTEICWISLLDIDTVFGAHMVPLGTCRFTPPNETSISS